MKLFSLPAQLLAAKTVAPAARLVEGVRLEDIASVANLARAFERVRVNKGAAGGDGVSIEEFATALGVNLEQLSADLLSDRYRPRRLRVAAIPKKDGSKRRLLIPAVVDRVAQTAALLVLAPIIDPRLSDVSWAYRSGRGVDDAIADVRAGFEAGFRWTVDADIAKYFDRVPHDRLIDELTIWVDDERVIRLVARWIASFSRTRRGIAQGSPLSPLLANLYLHPVDRLLVGAGYRVIRYADDLVVLTRTAGSALAARQLLVRLLRARDLTLNVEKSKIIAPGTEFSFLGQVCCAPGDGNA